jgi:hypothetical protein
VDACGWNIGGTVQMRPQPENKAKDFVTFHLTKGSGAQAGNPFFPEVEIARINEAHKVLELPNIYVEVSGGVVQGTWLELPNGERMHVSMRVHDYDSAQTEDREDFQTDKDGEKYEELWP